VTSNPRCSAIQRQVTNCRCRPATARGLSDAALEAQLFPASTALAAIKSRRTPADWPAIHRELKRPGVTLRLLWEEHRAAHPEGFARSSVTVAPKIFRLVFNNLTAF
jgi:transposase